MSIVVIGSSNTDMVVRTPHIPAPGETILGDDLVLVSGGKGANQAVAAARLGAEVTLVARVGADLFGERAVREIAAAGVDTTYVVRDSATPSGVALICVADDGQNSIVVAPGANGQLTPQDVDAALPAIRSASVVVLQLETPLETVEYAIRLAKREGKQVILNPAPARDLPFGLLDGVDILTPNEIEAAMLLKMADGLPLDPSIAGQALLRLGPASIIVTIGAEGAIVAKLEGSTHVPALKVEAVDTTAAGDCFTGALACALAEGKKLSDAARFAAAAASLSVTRLGAQSSMPTRAEVEKSLAEPVIPR
jgi:ribokinase